MIEDVTEDAPRISLQREIEELHKCIGALDNMLDILYERLNPVLQSVPDASDEAVKTIPLDASACSLVEEVRSCKRRLTRMDGGLVVLMNRLQI